MRQHVRVLVASTRNARRFNRNNLHGPLYAGYGRSIRNTRSRDAYPRETTNDGVKQHGIAPGILDCIFNPPCNSHDLGLVDLADRVDLTQDCKASRRRNLGRQTLVQGQCLDIFTGRNIYHYIGVVSCGEARCGEVCSGG